VGRNYPFIPGIFKEENLKGGRELPEILGIYFTGAFLNYFLLTGEGAQTLFKNPETFFLW